MVHARAISNVVRVVVINQASTGDYNARDSYTYGQIYVEPFQGSVSVQADNIGKCLEVLVCNYTDPGLSVQLKPMNADGNDFVALPIDNTTQ